MIISTRAEFKLIVNKQEKQIARKALSWHNQIFFSRLIEWMNEWMKHDFVNPEVLPGLNPPLSGDWFLFWLKPLPFWLPKAKFVKEVINSEKAKGEKRKAKGELKIIRRMQISYRNFLCC